MNIERDKFIDSTVSHSVHPNGEWCGENCNYLDDKEPRCSLYDDGPLSIQIEGKYKRKRFIRCNECKGLPR